MMTHLNVRSYYSLAKSTLSISQMVQYAKSYGYRFLALTDVHVMYGTMEFIEACKQNDLIPIIGMEVYVDIDGVVSGFVLLAKNVNGYQHLMALSSLIAKKSVCPLEWFIEHCQDVKVISFADGGYLDEALTKQQGEAVLIEKLQRLQQLIPHFVMGISYQESSFWQVRNQQLMQVCRQLDIALVALPKVYYGEAKDGDLLHLLACIDQACFLDDVHIARHHERYFLNPQEMSRLYDEELLLATDKIAQECQCTFSLPVTTLPTYSKTHGLPLQTYFRSLCVAGLKKRLNGQKKPAYVERLKYEMQLIEQMGFVNYFLIVYDLIRYGRSQQIYVGPGRGSAAGSLVAYCLGITQIDPLEYHLLFERFLNPERKTMPDIDMDFPDIHRQQMIDYLKQTYGQDHVAHILALNTFGPRAAWLAVCQAMQIDQKWQQDIAKCIGNLKSLEVAYTSSNRMQTMLKSSKALQKAYQMACQIQGIPRHETVHASGIVLADQPLQHVSPTVDTGILCTQYHDHYLEELGLIKIDVLSIKNLTLLETMANLWKRVMPDFDLLQIPFADQKTYRLFAHADTMGIFQFESDGIRALLRKIQPHHFDDLVACLSLFRPGPKDQIQTYLKNRQAPESIVYPNEKLIPILKSTYGIMIFQEQIMQMVQVVAGFSLGKADILRRAISKKDHHLMEQLKQDFLDGAKQRGYLDQVAQTLFQQIETFAGYGYNKSHAVVYGYVAYQMAYIKANAPAIFYQVMLENFKSDHQKTALYIQELKQKGYQIIPCSVNDPQSAYIIRQKQVIVPLTYVKDIRQSIVIEMQKEIQKRSFSDLHDFVARMRLYQMNQDHFVNLIKAGMMDCFGYGRETMIQNMSEIFRYAEMIQVKDQHEQIALNFNIVSKHELKLYHQDTWQVIFNEKQVLGFTYGIEPITLLKQKYHLNGPLLKQIVDQHLEVWACGQLMEFRNHRTKKGTMMAFCKVADESGTFDLMLMPRHYEKIDQKIQKGQYIGFHVKMLQDHAMMMENVEIYTI